MINITVQGQRKAPDGVGCPGARTSDGHPQSRAQRCGSREALVLGEAAESCVETGVVPVTVQPSINEVIAMGLSFFTMLSCLIVQISRQ